MGSNRQPSNYAPGQQGNGNGLNNSQMTPLGGMQPMQPQMMNPAVMQQMQWPQMQSPPSFQQFMPGQVGPTGSTQNAMPNGSNPMAAYMAMMGSMYGAQPAQPMNGMPQMMGMVPQMMGMVPQMTPQMMQFNAMNAMAAQIQQQQQQQAQQQAFHQQMMQAGQPQPSQLQLPSQMRPQMSNQLPQQQQMPSTMPSASSTAQTTAPIRVKTEPVGNDSPPRNQANGGKSPSPPISPNSRVSRVSGGVEKRHAKKLPSKALAKGARTLLSAVDAATEAEQTNQAPPAAQPQGSSSPTRSTNLLADLVKASSEVSAATDTAEPSAKPAPKRGYADLSALPEPDTTRLYCRMCFTSTSPEWRRGPDGPKTLCNACGLHWAKLKKRRRAAAMTPRASVLKAAQAAKEAVARRAAANVSSAPAPALTTAPAPAPAPAPAVAALPHPKAVLAASFHKPASGNANNSPGSSPNVRGDAEGQIAPSSVVSAATNGVPQAN